MSQLHAQVFGEHSRHLVILHGFLGMGDNWKTHAKRWVEEGWTVHLLDQRNHGRSFWSDLFDYPVLAEDLRNYIKASAIENCTLLGHSMGGKTIMHYAGKYPSTVDRLIVADMGVKGYVPHHHDILNGLASLDFNRIETRKEAEAQLQTYVPDFGTRQFLMKNLYWKEKGVLGLRLNIAVLKQAVETVVQALPDHIMVDLPTLFLKGAQSDYILEGDKAGIVKQFPKASFATIEKAGHWLHAENPEDFRKAIHDWLEKAQ